MMATKLLGLKLNITNIRIDYYPFGPASSYKLSLSLAYNFDLPELNYTYQDKFGGCGATVDLFNKKI